MIKNNQYYMTFGTDHMFPRRQVKFFCVNSHEAHELFSSVFKAREGAYAFLYSDEEFKDTSMKEDIKAYIFGPSEQSFYDVQAVLSPMYPKTPLRIKSSLFDDIVGNFGGIHSGWLNLDTLTGREKIHFRDIDAIVCE